MQDSWEIGDPYDLFMGRWSRLVADEFVDWLSPEPGLTWLDVGCGSGALSEAVFKKSEPKTLLAIDQSEGFVKTAQTRLGSRAICKVGDAVDLPVENNSIDFAISGLVLNFIPNPEKGLSEMKRVTKKNGTVAIYIWDYVIRMEFLQYFWSAASELKHEASDLNEAKRFSDWNQQYLKALFKDAAFMNISTTTIEIHTLFKNFDDYWDPFLGGQGPAPSYQISLDETDRRKLKELLRKQLPIQADGSISLTSRALAIRGTVSE